MSKTPNGINICGVKWYVWSIGICTTIKSLEHWSSYNIITLFQSLNETNIKHKFSKSIKIKDIKMVIANIYKI